MNSTRAVSEDEEDQYVWKAGCWMKNVENGTTTNSTYCYYGHGVVGTLSVLLVVSMILALGGNIMVIMTIARHRGMRTRTNLLLANLAVADILVAVLDMPIALVTLINGDWIFSLAFCDFNGFAVGLGVILSVHTLMWISIHKFISITRPFSNSVTPTKIVMMILAAWSWSILFNLTPTSLIGLTDTEYKLGASQCGPGVPRLPKQYIHSGIHSIFNNAVPFSVMAYCYYRIFKEVKDHLNRMRDFADVSACNSLIEQKRIAETLCIVLSVFVLFFLPYFIYSLSLVFLGKDYVPAVMNPIAYTFGYMNSACNPIIYALRSPSFRKGFSEIICGHSRSRGGSIYRSPSIVPGGRMVTSIRRPVVNTGVTEKIKNDHPNNGRLPEHQQTRKNGAVISTMNNEPLPNATLDKTLEDQDDNTGNSATVYKNTSIIKFIKVKDSKDINIYHKCESRDSLTEKESDQVLSENNSNIFNPLEDEKLDVSKNSCVDRHTEYTNRLPLIKDSVNLNFKSNDERKRHASFQTIKGKEKHFEISASQPDITVLPNQNLNIHIGGTRISNSHNEILITTLEIEDNQIRSVSVGDVRVTCPVPTVEKHDPSQSARVPVNKKQERLKHPFIWQPSVDNLFGSPVISRRNFHIRKTILQSKSNEVSKFNNCGNVHREKKCSVSSIGSHKHLGVASLLTSVKKSISDLFHLDEESLCTSNSECGEAVSSKDRDAGSFESSFVNTFQDAAALSFDEKTADLTTDNMVSERNSLK